MGVETESFTGETATVSGWGFTSEDRVENLIETDRLRHTELDVISLKECRRRWQGENGSGATEIIPSMLCAIRVNTTSCYGDSGGKLYYP